MDLSRHLCVMLHCPSFFWGPQYMCVLHHSEGKRGVSIAGLLAVQFVQLRLWHSWYTFRTSLNWNDIAWLSRFVTFSVKNQFRYFAGPQHPWPLTWSCHCATNHKDCEVLPGRNNKLPAQHHRCKLSTKSEKLSAICRTLNGALQMKRMANKSLLLLSALSPQYHCVPSAQYLHSPD